MSRSHVNRQQSEAAVYMRRCLLCFPDSERSSVWLMCTDRARVVLAKLAMLKYVHVLLRATQCESVNAQSDVCGAGGYFSPLISGVAGLGRCLAEPPDKDAVCGRLPGACVAACAQSLTHHGTVGRRGEAGGAGGGGSVWCLYLYARYPSSTWQIRGYPRAVFTAPTIISERSEDLSLVSYLHTCTSEQSNGHPRCLNTEQGEFCRPPEEV